MGEEYMKKHTYSLIALIVFAGPFMLSFHPTVAFASRWPAVAITIALIGMVYILWDIFAVRYHHWEFNNEFVGSTRWLGLPPGEWFFFISVPYACIFVYEVIKTFFPDTPFNPSLVWIQWGLALISFFSSWVWRKQGYTFLVLISFSLFWVLSAILFPGIITALSFWLYLGFSTIAFLIVNGIYVNLPTIIYNPKAMWGIRLFRIPLEDFFYNVSLLGQCLIVYLFLRGR